MSKTAFAWIGKYVTICQRTMKYTFVSVIIPTFNEEKNILRCLKSIKKQSYKGNVEIILVDNFSTDNTIAIAKKYVHQIIVDGPERSTQRNIGARNAKGSWLLFIDADMELTPKVIEECISLTKKRLIAPIIAIEEVAKGYTFLGRALALEKNCYKGPTWITAARFFPKKYFHQIGGYDQELIAGEDWDITQRFLQQGFSMIITKSLVIHHESKDSIYKQIKKETYYVKHLDRYAKKHPLAFSYQQSILYRSLIWARSWNNILPHPVLMVTFLSYKLLIWSLWQWYKEKKSYVSNSPSSKRFSIHSK